MANNAAKEKFYEARFKHYSKKLAETGIKQGIVLKSIEESLRRDLIMLLTVMHSRNTTIAEIIGKNEKTVRNLKRKFDDVDFIPKRNREFYIGVIIHDSTFSSPDKWISLDTIYDKYLSEKPNDTEFDDKALEDAIKKLVEKKEIVEHKKRYTAFYRTNTSFENKRLYDKTIEEKYETVVAIASEFDNMVDLIGENPEAMSDVKFSEMTSYCLSDTAIEEINDKAKSYMRQLLKEYLDKANANEKDPGKKFRVIMGISPLNLESLKNKEE